jgi:hypothetical protein
MLVAGPGSLSDVKLITWRIRETVVTAHKYIPFVLGDGDAKIAVSHCIRLNFDSQFSCIAAAVPEQHISV